MQKWILILTAGLALIGCSPAPQESSVLSQSSGQINAQDRQSLRFDDIFFPWSRNTSAPLQVVDQYGRSIAGAQVLIGEAVNRPMIKNFLVTDSNGQFVPPEGWNTPQTVTINAPGFLRTSYLAQLPQAQTFQVKMLPPAKRIELKGKGTGFNIVDKDGFIDFAVMMPSPTKEDLFRFDVARLISPEMDEIEVVGQKAGIPSNVALPKQKENYVIGITLEKPTYRIYFDLLGQQSVFTLRGRFPFKDVISEMRKGATFNDLINYFDLQGGSLKNVNLTSDKTTLDLPVNELVFNQNRSFVAPTVKPEDVLVASAISEYQGILMPTDVKSVESRKKSTLTTAAGGSPFLLTAITPRPEKDQPPKKMASVSLVPFQTDMTPKHLPYLSRLQAKGIYEVSAQPMTTNSGLAPVATVAVLSKVEKKMKDGKEIEVGSTRVWEVVAPGWVHNIKLPKWEIPNLGANKRWEVSLMAGNERIARSEVLDLKSVMNESVTHATYSSVEFK